VDFLVQTVLITVLTAQPEGLVKEGVEYTTIPRADVTI
jgi:hypothetical protein